MVVSHILHVVEINEAKQALGTSVLKVHWEGNLSDILVQKVSANR